MMIIPEVLTDCRWIMFVFVHDLVSACFVYTPHQATLEFVHYMLLINNRRSYFLHFQLSILLNRMDTVWHEISTGA